jgi:single-strand DNA-binding protein
MAKGTVNKAIILGRLGQDPETRQTAGGTPVCNLSIATNEMGPKDQAGNRAELTEWHRVTLFGRTAEIAQQYLTKGSLCYIEGRIQTRKWQDQSGADRYSTEIVGNEIQLMGGGQQTGAPQAQQYQQPQAQPQAQQYQQPQAQPQAQQPAPFDQFGDSDVPF